MIETRSRLRSVVALAVLPLLSIKPTIPLAPSVQASATEHYNISAPFSWQNDRWCPSYQSYSSCDITQSPSQYTVSFTPSQVSEIDSNISLRMNSAATLSGAINTFGEETWTAPTTFTATIALPCNATGKIVNWPAFWTLGATGTWPADGEIDILEGLAGKATWTYHYANSSGQNAYLSGTPAGNWCGTHIYAATWQSSSITFTWDGRKVGQVSSSQIGVPIASGPMYAIFDYGANPVDGGPTTGGVAMTVSRYSASSASACSNLLLFHRCRAFRS
jgi:Glycosyl hydrolases family 16